MAEELPSAVEMVRKYLAIRDFIKQATDAHDASMAPYKQAMVALEGAAALMMQQTGQKALSTDAGTAFQTSHMSATCTDRSSWLAFVFSQEGVDANAHEGITAHISKEYVAAYMEAHEGHPPPGVKVETFMKTVFRKA